MTLSATPIKLKTGAWGARTATADVQKGDMLRVTTRSGKSWEAQVIHVVWRGDDVAICAVKEQRRAPMAPRSRASEYSEGCSHCRATATRTAQLWEDCDYCGSPVVYR